MEHERSLPRLQTPPICPNPEPEENTIQNSVEGVAIFTTLCNILPV